MAVAEETREELADLCRTYRAFLEEHVYPAEDALARENDDADALIAQLRARAKAAGLWAPTFRRMRAGRAEDSSPTRS
jgi:alkylation response protein AidB-like acyl-CoA dehydrogenase